MHLLRTLHIKKARAEYPAVSRSIIKAGASTLCFSKLALEERREIGCMQEDSRRDKPHSLPLEGTQREGDNFPRQFSGRFETWRRA